MQILEQQGEYRIISQFNIIEKLENKNYIFDFDIKGNCFLKDTFEFKFDKIYDVEQSFIKHALTSFEKGTKNIGISLVGQKGCGKSITAKLLAKQSNLPVIIIDKSLPKSLNFVSLLNSIEQDFVIFIDEFEKLFPLYLDDVDGQIHKQESFLSILDGINNKYKKLFIFTSNSELDNHLINRPSRILFLKEYNGISDDLALEIIKHDLIYKDHQEDLINNINKNECTIDILLSIIKEINIHNKPYSSFKSFFNFRTELKGYNIFIKKENESDDEYKLISKWKETKSQRDILEVCLNIPMPNGKHERRYMSDGYKTGEDLFIVNDIPEYVVKIERSEELNKYVL